MQNTIIIFEIAIHPSVATDRFVSALRETVIEQIQILSDALVREEKAACPLAHSIVIDITQTSRDGIQ